LFVAVGWGLSGLFHLGGQAGRGALMLDARDLVIMAVVGAVHGPDRRSDHVGPPELWAFSVSLMGRVSTRRRSVPGLLSSFTESVPPVRARLKVTTRLRAELGCALVEHQRCVSEGSLGTVKAERRLRLQSLTLAAGSVCALGHPASG